MIDKKVVSYNGEIFENYEIYKDGKVFSLKTNQFIKDRFHSGGYKMVTLRIPKQKECFIHRLVAFAFIPNPLNKRCVNHKNGIKTDNSVENLEWVTDGENQKHSYANGLNSRNGENNGLSKLKSVDVKEIRQSTLSTKELSAFYKVSKTCIRDIKNKKSWTHI